MVRRRHAVSIFGKGNLEETGLWKMNRIWILCRKEEDVLWGRGAQHEQLTEGGDDHYHG